MKGKRSVTIVVREEEGSEVAEVSAVWPPESLPGRRARREREEDDRSLREGGGSS